MHRVFRVERKSRRIRDCPDNAASGTDGGFADLSSFTLSVSLLVLILCGGRVQWSQSLDPVKFAFAVRISYVDVESVTLQILEIVNC